MTTPNRSPWWLANLIAGLLLAVLFFVCVASGEDGRFEPGGAAWWMLTAVTHIPYAVILFFLVGGLIERVGFYWHGRTFDPPGRLPRVHPTVCVQLPMFNEHAVAQRVIEAACALDWPVDRLTVQVLDDSTDEDTRALVEGVCARMRSLTGVRCYVRHRADRRGYKAGALEEGRKQTAAELIAIFDSDFVPPPDFLTRMVPHFYSSDGRPERRLALVQAQWGHLNHDQSNLTLAKSLWVDDHHTLQMSWRSARWRFVNFTGTAGIWRSSAIETVGGWRAASLVEDCELSFRHLFGGYRTKFVKEIVVPAELPATYTAYKAQQKRWTQGWVQLQRLHLRTLLFDFRCSPSRRLHLTYHMCISWQWPAWALWTSLLPIMIHSGLWFGASSIAGAVLYMGPVLVWTVLAATLASLQTKHTYPGAVTPTAFLRRFGRVVPYMVINTGMLPHQFSSFLEGLFGRLHSEFERTPKAASGSGIAERPTVTKRYGVKIHWPYVLTELGYASYQLAWAVVFATSGLVVCALGAAYLAACVSSVAFFYGDHAGKVCFVVDRHRLPGSLRGDSVKESRRAVKKPLRPALTP
jgi:cellulose synthase/poly-beta-1,6-N-acetylglucosamine synthase-like glycosyltransferase